MVCEPVKLPGVSRNWPQVSKRGGCGIRGGHFKSYILHVFIDQHGQVVGDSMTHSSRSPLINNAPATGDIGAFFPSFASYNLPVKREMSGKAFCYPTDFT